MSGAIMCAALLHIALFIAIDRFAHFPEASLNSAQGRVTRIQLSLPQAQPEPKFRTAEEIETNRSHPKDQVEQNTSRAEPTAKETKQKSSVKTVKNAQSPQQNPAALTTDEISAKDTRGSSTSKASPSDSENKREAENRSIEQPFHRLATEGIPQASNQKPVSQQEFTVYLQQLIEEKRRYPRAARRRNIEGAVEFSMHVSREGALEEIILNSSSGSRLLDKAAEDLLERVFPVDYPLQENVRTTIRIIYKLTEA
ncbi:MAG: TonB family protein [Spirochaetia bacterium]|nr:TonB family protein [Spirochaetia bacterium]